MKRAQEWPWRVPVSVTDVPESGQRFEIAADAATRTAIAEIAGLRTLPRLEASFDVKRHGREGLRVVGRVSADVGQVCVVTLEPMQSTVEEAIDLIFSPDAPVDASEEHDRNRDEVGAAAPRVEGPEPLVGGRVDLGALATEFLILGIDPYPRKPGATFEAPSQAGEDTHPFAALAALRKRGMNDGH